MDVPEIGVFINVITGKHIEVIGNAALVHQIRNSEGGTDAIRAGVVVLHRVISPESDGETGSMTASPPDSFFAIVRTEDGNYTQLHQEIDEQKLPDVIRKHHAT